MNCPTRYEKREWHDGRVEHDVPCGGTLRRCWVCGAERYCGREGRCLDAGPGHFVRRLFNIEDTYGEGGIVGWTAGEHWNGWSCPRFELQDARRVIAFNNDPPCTKAHYDAATDTVIVQWEDDEPQTFAGHDIETPEGTKHVYDVGAWCWIWDDEPLM